MGNLAGMGAGMHLENREMSSPKRGSQPGVMLRGAADWGLWVAGTNLEVRGFWYYK